MNGRVMDGCDCNSIMPMHSPCEPSNCGQPSYRGQSLGCLAAIFMAEGTSRCIGVRIRGTNPGKVVGFSLEEWKTGPQLTLSHGNAVT